MTSAASDIWLTAEEIADANLPGMPSTKRSVNRLAERASWAANARPRRARGGGLEYPITVLSIEAQRILIGTNDPVEKRLAAVGSVADWTDNGRSKSVAVREVARTHGVAAASLYRWIALIEGKPRADWPDLLSPPAESAREAMKAANALKTRDATREDGMAELATLSEKQRAQAEAKAAVLRAVIGFANTCDITLQNACKIFLEAWNEGEDDFDLGPAARSVLPTISLRSIERWKTDYEKGGLAALAPKHGRHRKGQGKVNKSVPVRTLIEGMLVQHPDSSSKLTMRALRARLPNEKLPSYRTVQRWMEDWRRDNAALYEMARSPDGFKSKMRLVAGKADEDVLRLNQRWEMDSTPNDVILNDGARHTLVGVIDVWSRRARLLVSRSSSAAAVSACLRGAILEWGMPEELKTDNGADYISRNIKQLCLGLEIHQEICPPFSPEKKPHIERFFGTFTRDLIELLDGFVGHNVEQRKRIEDRKAFAQRLGSAKEEPPELLMSAEELQTFCDHWCESLYSRDEHSSLGRSPFAQAQSWTGPVRRITNERALDVLLMPIPGDDGTRTVTKRGIQFEHFFYTDPALQPFVRQRVQVRLDEEDWGRVLVLSKDGEFICWALCPERSGVSRAEAAQWLREDGKRIESQFRKQIRRAKKDARVQTVAADILGDAIDKASSVVAFPNVEPAQPHETLALTRAAEAAQARGKSSVVEKREDVSAEQIARLEPPKERRKSETPHQRFVRWETINASISASEPVDDEESTFWRSYQRSSEWGAITDQIEEFGRTAVLGSEASQDAG